MEIGSHKPGEAITCKGSLQTLHPFLDHSGILRVGGRIGNAHIAYNARHPIILQKSSHLAALLIAHTHLANMQRELSLRLQLYDNVSG